MDAFLKKHSHNITSILSCFDRVIFKGYLPICHPKGVEKFLAHRGIDLRDFYGFAKNKSHELTVHAQKIAVNAQREYIYLNKDVKKEELARSIAQRLGITEGLICVLAIVEHNTSFALRMSKHPHLIKARPRCLTLYFYFVDKKLGFIHVRIPTWMPFTIQVYVNGHEWLAKQLDKHGIGYAKQDNAFTALEDAAKAQRIANQFSQIHWQRMLDHFAKNINSLLRTLFKDDRYYWVIDQAEFSTDILFRSPEALGPLNELLQRNATVCLSPEDILRYFGRKRPGAFREEVKTYYVKRHVGARVKHVAGCNWIKMYDKSGSVLRVETVINNPYQFRVRRRGKRKGQEIIGWFPLCKRLSHLFRYAQVSLTANTQYLNALSVVDDPTEAYDVINSVCEPARFQNRRRRALNPLRTSEVNLFVAVMRGENTIAGFSNRMLAARMGIQRRGSSKERKRQSAKVTRLVQLLRAHKLVAKIPRARRYHVTLKGLRIMSAAIHIRKVTLIDELQVYKTAA
jgi:hypothetical protein